MGLLTLHIRLPRHHDLIPPQVTAANLGRQPNVGRENPGLAPGVGVVADGDPREEINKLQCCVTSGKQLPPVLELWRPKGPHSWGRVFLPAVPRAAAT